MAVCQSMPITEKYATVCPNGPNSHSFCMDVCKDKCSENMVVYSGDCPGQNVEDCIRACPSNLKAFGACVRVCNWRCPSLDEDEEEEKPHIGKLYSELVSWILANV